MGYKHLTREQRYAIEALLQTPMSLREIGADGGDTGGYGRRSVVGMTRWRAISDTVGEEDQDQDGTGYTVPEA